MDIKDQNSLIGNVIAFTLTLIVLLFVIFCAILSIFFPKTYGNLLFSVGFKNLSLPAYEHSYTLSNDINDLYLLVSKSISANNSEYIVKSYDILQRQADYKKFIEYVEKTNINACSSTLEMLYLSNEDNYLKGKYVIALKAFKGNDAACEYAYNDLKKYIGVTSSEERINFVFGYYVGELKTKEDCEYLTYEIKRDIYDYFYHLYNIYDTEINDLNYVSTENHLVNRFNLLKLNYRLQDIIYAMKQIDGLVSMGDYMQGLDIIEKRLLKDFPDLM